MRICVLNDEGVAGDAEFQRLFRRQARRGYRPGDDLVTLCAFDLLVLRGRSVMQLSLLERKARLDELLDDLPQVKSVGHLVRDGEALYAAALHLGLEGVIAKRIAAPYQPGVRSTDWRKIKRPGSVH